MQTTLYLKYTNNNWSTESILSFVLLHYYLYDSVGRIQGKTLGQTFYSHQTDTRKEYEITIGFDELYLSANVTYIENFYKGSAWKISTDGITYIDVDLQESGRIPYDYMDGNKNMKAITLNLFQKYKD